MDERESNSKFGLLSLTFVCHRVLRVGCQLHTDCVCVHVHGVSTWCTQSYVCCMLTLCDCFPTLPVGARSAISPSWTSSNEKARQLSPAMMKITWNTENTVTGMVRMMMIMVMDTVTMGMGTVTMVEMVNTFSRTPADIRLVLCGNKLEHATTLDIRGQ